MVAILFWKFKILKTETKTKQASFCPINISHKYFSLAPVLQIPAFSLNTCDKWPFDSLGQYHWSNKYVWCQSQRRNNWSTYAWAANKLQVCLAGKEDSCTKYTRILFCPVFRGTASHTDKGPSSTLVATLVFVFPHSKSLIQIVSANNWRWILLSLPKSLKNALGLKTAALCKP